jgi:hypothetical protein
VCRLYDLHKSNVELLVTLSKAQECLQARFAEQFEESRAEDCDPHFARGFGGDQPQRRTIQHSAAAASAARLRNSACSSPAPKPPAAASSHQRSLHSPHSVFSAPQLPSSSSRSSAPSALSPPPPQPNPRARTSAPALCTAFSSGLFVPQHATSTSAPHVASDGSCQLYAVDCDHLGDDRTSPAVQTLPRFVLCLRA